MPQVRQAFDVVAENIMASPNSEGSLMTSTDKDTNYGRARLTVFNKIKDVSRPESLYLSLTKDDNYILESQLPLRESESWVVNDSMRFADFRGNKKIVSAYDLQKDFSMDKYRHMWRGVRWVAVNILDWNKEGLIMPEELDHPQTSLHLLPKGEDESVIIDNPTTPSEIVNMDNAKVDLLSIKENNLPGIIDRLERLRSITRTSGVEVGGSIGVRELDGKNEYYIESLDTGTEEEVKRIKTGNVNFHTHPSSPDKITSRLSDNTHFDMPSHYD